MAEAAGGAVVPAFDRRVWRAVGDPLVPPSAPAGAPGPLAGSTVAVKDVFAVAGFAIGAGVPAYLEEAEVRSSDADAVSALRRAGASIAGIARTDQFAYSIAGRNPAYGTPPNPAAPGAIPGGSTSGPAVAVSLGQADVGLGTDTAGSIRVPASYQGLWGLRTTHGAVSRSGMLPLAPSFDTVGWLARDAATLFAAARASLPDGWRPAPRSLVWPALLDTLDPVVRAVVDTALERLAAAGHAPGVIRPEVDPAELHEAFRTVQAAEAWRANGDWIGGHPDALAPDVAARFAWASTVDAAAEHAARAALAVAAGRLDSALGDAVLLVPSAASAAPSLEADGAAIEAARRATLTLTAGARAPRPPAPAGAGAHGAGGPLGLCLVGPRGGDLGLLEFGESLARVLAE